MYFNWNWNIAIGDLGKGSALSMAVWMGNPEMMATRSTPVPAHRFLFLCLAATIVLLYSGFLCRIIVLIPGLYIFQLVVAAWVCSYLFLVVVAVVEQTPAILGVFPQSDRGVPISDRGFQPYDRGVPPKRSGCSNSDQGFQPFHRGVPPKAIGVFQ